MNRSELQILAETRLLDAEALLDVGRWSGAYYLTGYAVECGLKACIASMTQAGDFPDKDLAAKSWTHNLEALVNLSRLTTSLDQQSKASADFKANWELVRAWKEMARYEIRTESDARDLFEAVTDPIDGIMPWVKVNW